MSNIGPSQVYEIEYVEMLRTSCATKDAEIAALQQRVLDADAYNGSKEALEFANARLQERLAEADEMRRAIAETMQLHLDARSVAERERDKRLEEMNYLQHRVNEALAKLAATRAVLRRVVEALAEAKQFISNGIEFGYIANPVGEPECYTFGNIMSVLSLPLVRETLEDRP